MSSTIDTDAIEPDASGFYVLNSGLEALAARLLLAERAERSLDVQYYAIADDLVGRLFVGYLVGAADRGVRVRLLLDDVHTRGHDWHLAALSAHSGIDLKVFNPFSRSRPRILSAFTDFSRVNRRMHNKSFTVDGQFTIVGGRNISNEYFEISGDLDFRDIDLLGIGPVVAEVTESFDTYWDNKQSLPVAQVVSIQTTREDLIRQKLNLNETLDRARETPFGAALKDEIVFNLERRRLPLYWGDARVLHDSPDKTLKPVGIDGDGLLAQLRRAADSHEELILVSAYFVPGRQGVAELLARHSKGTRIVVITNSLASTDVVAVHAGYAAGRRALLEGGIELFEVKARLPRVPRRFRRRGSSRASLHAKLFIADRQQVFIGSFNLDPRSVYLNTEMGVLVDSPELADDLALSVLGRLDEVCYRVRLSRQGELYWETSEHGETHVCYHEPGASVWRRLLVYLLKFLPIERQL